MRLLDRQWTERNDSTGGEKRLFCQSFIGQQVLGQKAMVGPIRPPDVFCPQTQQYLQTSGQRGQRRVFFHRRGPFGQTTARNKRGQKGAEELLPHSLRGRPALQEAGFGWGVGLTHANAHTCECTHTECGAVWIRRRCRLELPETGRVLLGPKNARQPTPVLRG